MTIRLMTVFAAAVAAFAQQEPRPAGGGPRGGGGGGGTATEPEIKPYERVIIKEAKSQTGLFSVHQVKGKHYFEIPANQLNRDMLLVVSFKSTANGLGYGGTEVEEGVVRWERRDKKLLLRSIAYDVVSQDGDPMAKAVHASNEQTVVMVFNIEALGKDDAPVIDVTRLFTTDVTEFSARRTIGARGFDGSRSLIEKVRAFPMNINVEALHTYTGPEGGGPGGAGAPTPGTGRGTAMRPGTNATVVVSYSMIQLPEMPMRARLFDDRMGYFNLRRTSYVSPSGRAKEIRYVKRWRLEKKDSAAAVSEPIKPIVFYIDPATPPQWVPFVKKGVEDWQPAFESAGFTNAIQARETPKDDPDFSLEDARYSSIRWLASPVQNAYGPSVADPRSGEIIEADIKMFHNVLLLLRNWYFTQVGHLDKRAQKFPVPDELMGELIRYVVAHEVGHSIGLQHNMKASGMYSLQQVRDKNFVKKMGHTPTLMDYSRFNYVAQPEDGIALEDLIPKIAPYDHYAIHWGYAPIPQASSAEDEHRVLDQWLREQESKPWLRFSVPGGTGIDPTEQTEAVGDADAVLATALGTKNIKRALDLAPGAFPANGENNEDLGDLYNEIVRQWRNELGHITPLIGGMQAQNRHQGQNGPVFTPVPRERQKQAVRFLSDNLFATPSWLIRPDILSRTTPQGALSQIGNLQRAILDRLLETRKLERMMENEALHGAQAYAPADFFSDLRAGVFGELSGAAPRVDPYRRNLQRIFVDLAGVLLNRPAAPPQAVPARGERPIPYSGVNDTRALVRSELRAIAFLAKSKETAATDTATRAHLADLQDQIAKILDPKFAPAAPPAAAAPTRRSIETCWPENE